MAINAPRHPQAEYTQRGTQTEDSPLDPGAFPQLRSAGCSCSCSCPGEEPLPPPDISVSERSMLGAHPPRLARFTNRVVSAPSELVEPSPIEFLQPRIASMPSYFPPMFPEDYSDEYEFEQLIPPQIRYPECEERERVLMPQTPSPCATSGRENMGVIDFAEGEHLQYDTEGWITWASSPPKPIPALHGPLSLPYARCPSGAEGTVIESDDRVSNMIWGLDNGQTLAQTDSTLTTAHLGEVDSDDSFVLAAARLSGQMKGLTVSKDSVDLASQLSGLGLHINLASHRQDARSATFSRQREKTFFPDSKADTHLAKTSARVPPRGAPLVHRDRPRPSQSIVSQLPTPPLSNSTHWTPRLSGDFETGLSFSPIPNISTVGLSPALGLSGHRYSFSGDPALSASVLDRRVTTAQDWQAHPNSNAPTQCRHDYSLDSDSHNPGAGFDVYDQPPHSFSGGSSGVIVSSRLEATGFQGEKKTTYKNKDRLGFSRQGGNSSRLTHGRLPALEEGLSFGSSPRRPSSRALLGSQYSGQRSKNYKGVESGTSKMDLQFSRPPRAPGISFGPPVVLPGVYYQVEGAEKGRAGSVKQNRHAPPRWKQKGDTLS